MDLEVENQIDFSENLFNPNFWHIRESFLNPDIRHIILKGGSSSAKSYSFAQAVIISTLEEECNTLIFRKTGASIQDTIYEDFKTIISNWEIESLFRCIKNKIICANGKRIVFKGLDEEGKIKGVSQFKRIAMEETDEFDFSDFKQLRKRLRGMKGQQLIWLFNPISETHWIKQDVIDKEEWNELPNYIDGICCSDGKEIGREYTTIRQKQINSPKDIFNPRTNQYEVHPPDTVILHSNYLNNFWVVGSPCGTFGFYDRQTVADFEKDKINDPEYYRIYALGDWGSIKTGGEFWKSFDQNRHITKIPLFNSPIHISVDNNVLPYIAISFWQIDVKNEKSIIKQIHEIPAKDPFNTVTRSAQLAVKWLKSINSNHKVFFYGDTTTKANNTIDDDKQSFFDKFLNVLQADFDVEVRFPTVNPSVQISGEFINDIYDNKIPELEIQISDTCKESIKDYNITKQDVNGGILKRRIRDKKTLQSYEESGHFSDIKRYFICEAFKDIYTKYSLRRKRSNFQDQTMKYADFSKIELEKGIRIGCMTPDINGYFSFISAVILDKKIYIDDVLFNEDQNWSFGKAKEIITELEHEDILVESVNAYFSTIRELREQTEKNIRIANDFGRKEVRINAHSDYINNIFYFRSDYDSDEQYSALMENLFDCMKGKSIEAANILSIISEMYKRNYKDR